MLTFPMISINKGLFLLMVGFWMTGLMDSSGYGSKVRRKKG
jgi:hypothetical protein